MPLKVQHADQMSQALKSPEFRNFAANIAIAQKKMSRAEIIDYLKKVKKDIDDKTHTKPRKVTKGQIGSNLEKSNPLDPDGDGASGSSGAGGAPGEFNPFAVTDPFDHDASAGGPNNAESPINQGAHGAGGTEKGPGKGGVDTSDEIIFAAEVAGVVWGPAWLKFLIVAAKYAQKKANEKP